MPLFGKSHKSSPDIVRNLREALTIIEKGEKKSDKKAVEEVSRWLQAVKLIIYRQDNQELHTEQVTFVIIFCYNGFSGCSISSGNVQCKYSAIAYKEFIEIGI